MLLNNLRENNSMPKSTTGFTLIEIIVVITIMGVLSAIIYGSFNSAKAQSRDQRRISDIAGLQLALETYFNQNHQYPTDLQTLVPDYIPSIPVSPTGESYNYFPMGNSSSGPCISYQLWVKLETNNGTASSSKRGFNSADWPNNLPLANHMVYCGSGTASTTNASLDPLIYDVVIP
jgi:prepilin-type N-terminal cleavage/methylation domain-containing protein